MKIRQVSTVLFALAISALPLLCSAQAQTTTFRADSVGRQNWQITTISTFVRGDSSTYETRASEVFRTRALARQHVRAMFAERIRADSTGVEEGKRRVAALKTSRAALLSDLSRQNAAPRGGTDAPVPAEASPAVLPETKPKKKSRQ